jgi:GntR family transcriptional regulator, rspAB operon transcriptional repressor
MGTRLYSLLRAAIIQMDLRPGQPLSETELAKQLNVSRQPVREAFIKLAEAGLIEVRPQRGTFVLLISRQEVESARFVREAVEVAFVRKVATEAPAGTVAALRESIARQEAARSNEDAVTFLRHDEDFHHAIARAAGCESAWKLLETLKAQMDRVRFLAIEEATPTDVLIAQHKAIADAIEERDPDRAEAAMRLHLEEILQSLPRIAAALPDLFTD